MAASPIKNRHNEDIVFIQRKDGKDHLAIFQNINPNGDSFAFIPIEPKTKDDYKLNMTLQDLKDFRDYLTNYLDQQANPILRDSDNLLNSMKDKFAKILNIVED